MRLSYCIKLMLFSQMVTYTLAKSRDAIASKKFNDEQIYLHILPATVIGNVAEGFPLAVVARIPVLIQKRGYLIKKN